MSPEFMVKGLLAAFIAGLPLLAAWLLGIGYAFTKMKEKPTGAKVVIAVFLLFMMDFIIAQFFYVAIMPNLWEYIGGATWITSALEFCRSCFKALLFVGLAWAAFAKPKSA